MVPPPGSVKSVFQQQEYAFNAPPGMYPPHMSTISPVLVGSPPMWMIPQPQQWLEQIDHRGAESTGAAAEVLEGDASDLNYANPGPPIQVPKLATLNLLRTLSGESNFFSNSQLAGENHGPEGCNLFVFHIPNEITNLDLFNYFSPYGNVISARIMVDTGTGRSRGFGFVSYEKPSSATQAIEKMNGLQLGKKRLKVQLKKDKATGPHFPPGYGPEHHGGKGKGKGRSSRGARRQQVSARRALAPEEAQLEAVERAVAELSLQNQGAADF
jgi:RNA recognition motif-containing protein